MFSCEHVVFATFSLDVVFNLMRVPESSIDG